MQHFTNYKADTLQIEIKEDYAIVQLDNGKVNAINTQLLIDLKEINKDPKLREKVLEFMVNLKNKK